MQVFGIEQQVFSEISSQEIREKICQSFIQNVNNVRNKNQISRVSTDSLKVYTGKEGEILSSYWSNFNSPVIYVGDVHLVPGVKSVFFDQNIFHSVQQMLQKVSQRKFVVVSVNIPYSANTTSFNSIRNIFVQTIEEEFQKVLQNHRLKGYNLGINQFWLNDTPGDKNSPNLETKLNVVVEFIPKLHNNES